MSATWKEISNRFTDYRILGDIANALKHKKLTRENPSIAGSENIHEETVITAFEDKKGEYLHAETVVIVKLNNGTDRDILDILTNVMNGWLIYLDEVGITTKRPKLFPLRNPHKIVKRKDAKGHDITITKGVQMTQRFRFQKYNPITGKVEVQKLTGSKFVFQVFQKPYHIADLQSVSTDGEKVLNFRIVFTDEEFKEMDRLKTKKLLADFVKNIVHERVKRKRKIICKDGSTEYQVLLPDNEFKDFMRLRKDDSRVKFLTEILRDFDKSSVEKTMKGAF